MTKRGKRMSFGKIRIKKTLKRINRLLKDIDRNGYRCTGKPEPLKGILSGYWSVRIDKKKKRAVSQSFETARFFHIF